LLLNTTGRFDEGLIAARRARELDPLSVFNNMARTKRWGGSKRP
jgi:hypothetical protein